MAHFVLHAHILQSSQSHTNSGTMLLRGMFKHVGYQNATNDDGSIRTPTSARSFGLITSMPPPLIRPAIQAGR